MIFSLYIIYSLLLIHISSNIHPYFLPLEHIPVLGIAIGVGLIFSILIFAICRNPIISNVLIRWALIGSSLVEVSGSIGSVYSFLVLYALFCIETSFIQDPII